jgi:hypothetical protein
VKSRKATMNDDEKQESEAREQNTGARSQESEYKAETTLIDSLLFYSGS